MPKSMYDGITQELAIMRVANRSKGQMSYQEIMETAKKEYGKDFTEIGPYVIDYALAHAKE